MGELSIEELMNMPDLEKIDLDSLVIEVDGLSGTPSPSLIEQLRAGRVCIRFGKDPVSGQLVCLAWS